MDLTDALSELRDIHLPEQVSYWPPAPVWWILAALLLILAAYGLWRLQKRLRLHKRCRNALSELDRCRMQFEQGDQGDTARQLAWVNDINSVLRRVALLHYPHDEVAGLSGDRWVAFLHRCDQRQAITDEMAAALAQGRFAPRCDIDIPALDSMARHWIKDLYMTRINSDRLSTSTAAEHHA